MESVKESPNIGETFHLCIKFFLFDFDYHFRDDSVDVLCVADWGGGLSFYTLGGKTVSRDRSLNFIPLHVTYFPDGQYILVAGSNKRCLLMTHDGIQLATVADTFSSWVWSCAVHPASSHIVCSILFFHKT